MSTHENGSEHAPESGIDDTGTDATSDRDRVECGSDGFADEFAKLESRVAELEAAIEALRGYAGSVRSINRTVERRADRALATAERLQRRLDGEPSDVDLEATHVDTESADVAVGASTVAGEPEPIERPRTDRTDEP